MSAVAEPVIAEYEVFKNERNALAFFFYKTPVLDGSNDEGPFWFSIHDNNRIVAGTEKNHAIFPDVTPDVVDIARDRGVIMLVEFEEQHPVRCTPCYFSDKL